MVWVCNLINAQYIRFLFHYLDDFLTLAPANSSECATNVTIVRSVFHHLGLPLHPGKCKGSSSTLVFLCIELDSVTQIARLPPHKFAATIDLGMLGETVVYLEVVGIAHWFPPTRLQDYPPMDRRSCVA